jgi:UDPglucose 6-dehydrogenase
MRGATPVDLIKELLKQGATVSVFDPYVSKEAKKYIPTQVAVKTDYLKTVASADALVIPTEHQVFLKYDLKKVKAAMRGCLFFDAKRMFNPQTVRKLGFEYLGTGLG